MLIAAIHARQIAIPTNWVTVAVIILTFLCVAVDSNITQFLRLSTRILVDVIKQRAEEKSCNDGSLSKFDRKFKHLIHLLS